MPNEFRPKFPRTPFPKQEDYRLPFKTLSVEKLAVRVVWLWENNNLTSSIREEILEQAIDLDKVEKHHTAVAPYHSPFGDHFWKIDAAHGIYSTREVAVNKINSIADFTFTTVEAYIIKLEKIYGAENAPSK